MIFNSFYIRSKNQFIMKALIQFFAISILLGTSLFSSCTDEITSDKSGPSNNNEYAEMTNTEIKKEFGVALAKVLAESAPVRELIKKEALRKIDYDYDVLYLMVKDEMLNDNTTIEGLLSKYLDQDFFKQIEDRIPNLTIFVPELPDNSFSAELWDPKVDIPDVGVRVFDIEGTPAYNLQKGEYIIGATEVPQYPIVVIKENERVIAGNMITKSLGEYGAMLKAQSNSNIAFVFLDDVFNNSNNSSTALRSRRGENISHNLEKAKEAYDIYKDVDGWHRDYVYYNLKPKSGIPRDSLKGPFIYSFKECLIGFELLGNPKYSLSKISDQTGDPNISSISTRGISWTEGEFEFLVKTYVASNSLAGGELKTFFRAAGSDLFMAGRNGSLIPLRMDLKLPLFEWNLENYAPTVKIAIEEVDDTQIFKNTETTTVEFAGNIGFDISFGKIVKKGLKFGASTKRTQTVVYEVTTSKGNDELGEVIVNFGDPIIESMDSVRSSSGRYDPDGPQYIMLTNYNSKYYTGWYRLYIAPEAM